MKGYFLYWGKAEKKTGQWHPLVCHMLDVAAVVREFFKNNKSFMKEWCDRLEISEAEILDIVNFFAAIHDLGKFSANFQYKVPELAKILQGLEELLFDGESHPSLAWLLWNKKIKVPFFEFFDIEKGTKLVNFAATLKPLLTASFGHHGRPVDGPGDASDLTYKKIYGKKREDDAVVLVFDLLDLFPECKNILKHTEKMISKRKEIAVFSFVLSGVIILADWTASDSINFAYLFAKNEIPADGLPGFSGLDEYFEHACSRAQDALDRQGLCSAAGRDIIDPWGELFQVLNDKKYKPSPLQQAVLDIGIPDEPALYIIEDAAGSGKTEAALILTARIMQQSKAEGFYFALPTMSTSNGMYKRIIDIYENFFAKGTHPSLILAHGGSSLHKEYQKSLVPNMKEYFENYMEEKPGNDNGENDSHDTSMAACSEWIADRSRKVFLAQAGVGCIDQAMLSVLYSRHNTLRMFGLSRRVLIIDEVHAYDTYMEEIIKCLVECQASQHKSVILLSATLPSKTKMELVQCYRKGMMLHEDEEKQGGEDDDKSAEDHYPLLTIATRNRIELVKLQTREDNERIVSLVFHTSPDEIYAFLKSVSEAGKCVVWIRNTVYDVQQAYERLVQELGEDRVMIFHSRYAMGHRQKIENRVLNIFGKESKPEDRSGKILVASQVVEQSLDLDFDEMVIDLCPVDLVIQRSGRLMRHLRDIL